VTNLNPDGPGSLQEACATPGPRIVVFAVSGVIHNMVTIENSNITIAGQTAPGAGITINGQLVSKEGISDVVIRHLRVRPLKVADSYAGPEGEARARRQHACGLANPMPDEWEKKNGLDPTRDDSTKVMPDGCTAVERYLAERAEALVKGTGAGR
jgi:hypothetical protein